MVNLFKLTLIKSGQSKRYDITPIVGNFSWDSNFSIMAALEMEVSFSDTKFFPKNPCDLGDIIILTKDKSEVFRGVIVNESRSGRNAVEYSVYDYAWYLGKSKTVYQFNGISATKAIEKILSDFGMQIGSIVNMPTHIDKIYIQESPAKIIQDIINKVQNSEGYMINVEMRRGRIYFEKRKDLLITGRFRIADNVESYDVLSSISEANRTRSIEDMRNRIRLIVDDEETEYEITAQTEDAGLINTYGLLEETFKIDAEDAAKSRQVAKILLQRLGRVHETNSVKLMGDVRFKAGRLFDVKESITGMNNRFMIASVKHSVTNQIHTMELELVLPEDVM